MFKFLIIFILLLAAVPAFRRFLFWLVVGRQMVKEQKKRQSNTTKTSRDGEIRVDYVPQDKNNPKFKGGQYVDYEEVKD